MSPLFIPLLGSGGGGGLTTEVILDQDDINALDTARVQVLPELGANQGYRIHDAYFSRYFTPGTPQVGQAGNALTPYIGLALVSPGGGMVANNFSDPTAETLFRNGVWWSRFVYWITDEPYYSHIDIGNHDLYAGKGLYCVVAEESRSIDPGITGFFKIIVTYSVQDL